MVQNKFSPICNISYPIWIKFGTDAKKKRFSSDCNFRENLSSEKRQIPTNRSYLYSKVLYLKSRQTTVVTLTAVLSSNLKTPCSISKLSPYYLQG